MHSYGTLMSYYKCAIMEIETKFNVLNVEFSLRYDRNPINSIKTRLKKPMSLKEKLEKKNLPLNLETVEKNINDVAGVRVVCSFEKDVYMLADALLKQDDIKLVSMKDYIANPKPNGYRSLHLIVEVPIFLANEKRIMKVEIQLRTIAMHSWASLEHQLRYKKDFDFNEYVASELLECASLSENLDKKMDNLRKLLQIDDDFE
ncbi:MAG: GTP pyrophosphokinase family protein [Oscillospiraceae bacterium]|nr:GTP pyrophosphokinase family protein [Oscillospiraceae bacterium]